MTEDEAKWREEQMAPFQHRLDDDPDHPGDYYLVDDGRRFKIFPDEDRADGTPKWGLLEFDGKEWAITDDDYELADLIRRIDEKIAGSA